MVEGGCGVKRRARRRGGGTSGGGEASERMNRLMSEGNMSVVPTFSRQLYTFNDQEMSLRLANMSLRQFCQRTWIKFMHWEASQ